MSDNAVGFSFQADVASAASLTHLVTGRVLKALSDGGVHLYAVVASITLGNMFSTRSSLECTVHSKLAAKKGVQGFLATALSIGWGHSLVPVEMSRTKAGTNALLLISALPAGSSYYFAAECLSELFLLWGFQADKIPNVDVLKSMVSYLAPFLEDLGFSQVLELVTTGATHAILKTSTDCPGGLTYVGEPRVLASAIKQLVFTSQSDGSVYFLAKQRGAWVAAFASHILGIGAINNMAGLQIIESPSSIQGGAEATIDYPLAEALEKELKYHPQIQKKLIIGIHSAICRLSIELFRKVGVKFYPGVRSKVNGPFNTTASLAKTLADMGINEECIKKVKSGSFPPLTGWAQTHLESRGLSFLTTSEANELKLICPYSENRRTPHTDCVCCSVGRMIIGFSVTALALVQCRYEKDEIRVARAIITGNKLTDWTLGCISGKSPHASANWAALHSDELMTHVHTLLHGSVSDNKMEALSSDSTAHMLGLSAGSYAVFFTCLVDESNSYDDWGRVITISTGRASINGVFRKRISEVTPRFLPHLMDQDYLSSRTFLAKGSLLEPFYHPSHVSIQMTAQVSEHEIYIDTAMLYSERVTRSIPLRKCIGNLLAFTHLPPTCPHPPNKPFKIGTSQDNDMRTVLMGLNPIHQPTLKTIAVYALQGKRLEQILQCYKTNGDGTTLQLKYVLNARSN